MATYHTNSPRNHSDFAKLRTDFVTKLYCEVNESFEYCLSRRIWLTISVLSRLLARLKILSRDNIVSDDTDIVTRFCLRYSIITDPVVD